MAVAPGYLVTDHLVLLVVAAVVGAVEGEVAQCPEMALDAVQEGSVRGHVGELDAAFLHLCGYDRDDADFAMDTFPVILRNDEKEHGEYLTKQFVLGRYDTLTKAAESGEPYQMILDPPPTDSVVAHAIAR